MEKDVSLWLRKLFGNYRRGRDLHDPIEEAVDGLLWTANTWEKTGLPPQDMSQLQFYQKSRNKFLEYYTNSRLPDFYVCDADPQDLNQWNYHVCFIAGQLLRMLINPPASSKKLKISDPVISSHESNVLHPQIQPSAGLTAGAESVNMQIAHCILHNNGTADATTIKSMMLNGIGEAHGYKGWPLDNKGVIEISETFILATIETHSKDSYMWDKHLDLFGRQQGTDNWFVRDSQYLGAKDSNGNKDGFGIRVTESNGLSSGYIGNFKSDVKHGEGEYFHNREDGPKWRYKGEWDGDTMQGKGQRIYAFDDYGCPSEGIVFTGLWQGNQKSGRGIEVDYDTGEYYYGDWEGNKKTGWGIHIEKQNLNEVRNEKDWYSVLAQWALKDTPLGDPTSTELKGVSNFYQTPRDYSNYFSLFRLGLWEDDEMVEGLIPNLQMSYKLTSVHHFHERLPFSDLIFSGTGTYIYRDGSQYEGPVVNNQPHGQGMLIRPDNISQTVTFENGNKVNNVKAQPAPSVTRTPWSDEENTIIVQVYLDMLSKQLRQEDYSKTQLYNAVQPRLNGRSLSSIEFKLRNVSSIVKEHLDQVPLVRGLVPLDNAQKSLIDAVIAQSGQFNLLINNNQKPDIDYSDDFVILPLYQGSNIRKVPSKSGLNLWLNDSPAKLDEGEFNVSVPMFLYQHYKHLLPQVGEFQMHLPNGEIVKAFHYRSQSGRLCTMPSFKLGNFLWAKIDQTSDVFEQRRRTCLPYSYDDLIHIDVDAIKLTAVNGSSSEFKIELVSLGSYEKFKSDDKSSISVVLSDPEDSGFSAGGDSPASGSFGDDDEVKLDWPKLLVEIFTRLGGTAHLQQVYEQVDSLGLNLPDSYQAIIRRTLQQCDPDSDWWNGTDRLFRPVNSGTRDGLWKLLESPEDILVPSISPSVLPSNSSPSAPEEWSRILLRSISRNRDLLSSYNLNEQDNHRITGLVDYWDQVGELMRTYDGLRGLGNTNLPENYDIPLQDVTCSEEALYNLTIHFMNNNLSIMNDLLGCWRQVFEVAGVQTDVHKRAIFRRLSNPSDTLEAIGVEAELTRERVRQIVKRFEDRFSGIFDNLKSENYWIAEKLFLVHAFIWSYSCFTSFKKHTLSPTDQLEQRYGLEKGTINLWVKLIDTVIERGEFNPFSDEVLFPFNDGIGGDRFGADLPYLNLTSDNRVVPEVPWVPEIVLKSFDSRSVIPASELLANLYGSNGGSRLVPANIYYAVGHLVQKGFIGKLERVHISTDDGYDVLVYPSRELIPDSDIDSYPLVREAVRLYVEAVVCAEDDSGNRHASLGNITKYVKQMFDIDTNPRNIRELFRRNPDLYVETSPGVWGIAPLGDEQMHKEELDVEKAVVFAVRHLSREQQPVGITKISEMLLPYRNSQSVRATIDKCVEKGYITDTSSSSKQRDYRITDPQFASGIPFDYLDQFPLGGQLPPLTERLRELLMDASLEGLTWNEIYDALFEEDPGVDTTSLNIYLNGGEYINIGDRWYIDASLLAEDVNDQIELRGLIRSLLIISTDNSMELDALYEAVNSVRSTQWLSFQSTLHQMTANEELTRFTEDEKTFHRLEINTGNGAIPDSNSSDDESSVYDPEKYDPKTAIEKEWNALLHMIPITLKLENFMSYREEVFELDFTGMTVAILSDRNGPGKSALLDSITWALWGRCRIRSADDLVSLAAEETRVELTFSASNETYRVIRSHIKSGGRRKTGVTDLQLQIEQTDHFIPITEDSISNTQAKIISVISMDYETFINSAFLDEFTNKLTNRAIQSQRKEFLDKELRAYIQNMDSFFRDLGTVLNWDYDRIPSEIPDSEIIYGTPPHQDSPGISDEDNERLIEARSLLESGNLVDAFELAQMLSMKYPGNSECLDLMGDVHVELAHKESGSDKHLEEAFKHFEAAFHQEPGNVDYILQMAGMYRRSVDTFKEAVEMYKLAVEIKPDDVADHNPGHRYKLSKTNDSDFTDFLTNHLSNTTDVRESLLMFIFALKNVERHSELKYLVEITDLGERFFLNDYPHDVPQDYVPFLHGRLGGVYGVLLEHQEASGLENAKALCSRGIFHCEKAATPVHMAIASRIADLDLCSS